MSTTSVPSMTFNAPGNIRASASLAASGTANYDVDYSAKWEGRIHIKNTPGGSVSATRGVIVDIYNRYGSGPATGESPIRTLVLPSATASTAESDDATLPAGKYNIKITNIDSAQAVTVEISADTVDGIVTT